MGGFLGPTGESGNGAEAEKRGPEPGHPVLMARDDRSLFFFLSTVPLPFPVPFRHGTPGERAECVRGL